jgi:acyl-CoA thioesterase-1
VTRATRRALLLAALASAIASGAAAASPVVTLFGDSIMAGYGLSPADGMAAQLQAALAAQGVRAEVRNAGVPGDTSAGGLGRLNSAVRKDTTVCVVEFGGNDRRLFPASQTRDYLDAIVGQLKARGVRVILVEVGDPERRDAQRQLAQAHGVPLFPDLFEGVGPDLRQADGVHPNAAGEKLIAGRLAPVVAQALRGGARSS